jgi:nucleoside-diphosphate-sugar epimerase
MKALVIGGTGPTGHFLTKGLLLRGFQVFIFHRGTHESQELPEEVEHIHGDPHFLETIEDGLKGRNFDVVIATYGRVRHLAQMVKGKTGRFIAVTGAPIYRGYLNPHHNTPFGLPVPVREDAPLVEDPNLHRFSYLIAETEKAVMAMHKAGEFDVTCFRYPQVYGPHQLNPLEWCVIRRILDKRPHIILPDGGLTLETRGYSENVAHGVLLTIEQPKISGGQIYNIGDEKQLTLRQWVEVITQIMNYDWEIVGMPEIIAKPGWPMLPFQGPTSHRLMDIRKIQDQLGYRDKVFVEEALRRTINWYLENRPEPGGETEIRLQDPFNYQAEDQIIELYRKSINDIATQVSFKLPNVVHPYAHPKEQKQQRDHRQR